MRVSEVRTNTVGITKSNTKANYANKQAFSALPYVSKTTSRVFSVGRVICEAEEFLSKLNPVAGVKKAIVKANYKSPEDIRIENLVKKHRLEREIKQQNQVIEDYKNKEIIPREEQLKELTKSISDSTTDLKS